MAKWRFIAAKSYDTMLLCLYAIHHTYLQVRHASHIQRTRQLHDQKQANKQSNLFTLGSLTSQGKEEAKGDGVSPSQESKEVQGHEQAEGHTNARPRHQYAKQFLRDHAKATFSMTPDQYNVFKRQYAALCWHLGQFARQVNDTHRRYCRLTEEKEGKAIMGQKAAGSTGKAVPSQAVPNPETKYETKEAKAGGKANTPEDDDDDVAEFKRQHQDGREADILRKRRRFIYQLDRDSKYLAFWTTKMKKEVDQWFLTAEYMHLYS